LQLGHCERSGALLAKFCASAVFVLTPQTLHLGHQLRMMIGTYNLPPAAMYNNQ